MYQDTAFDKRIEIKIREALYVGAVSEAYDLVEQIEDTILRKEMLSEIREYDS